MSLEKFNLLNDIYYNNDYISLYIKDDAELFAFEYTEEDSVFLNKSIKRAIKKIGNIEVSDGFYDLETAYGYGGFYTNSDDAGFVRRAMNLYKQKCQKANIVAEFIRFHPFNAFPKNYSYFLDFNLYDRDIVVQNITQDALSCYSKKVRNTVKRANEKIIFQESNDIGKFIELYNITMKKNNASEFYFFTKEYYQNLLNCKNVKLYEIRCDNEIIAMGFFMFSDFIGYYHLSANTPVAYKLNANYALLYNFFRVAKDLKLDYFVLGGGTTPNADDSLLRFKKKFSKELKPFYISGNIYNKEVYCKYNDLWNNQSKEDVKYFLKYRLGIK